MLNIFISFIWFVVSKGEGERIEFCFYFSVTNEIKLKVTHLYCKLLFFCFTLNSHKQQEQQIIFSYPWKNSMATLWKLSMREIQAHCHKIFVHHKIRWMNSCIFKSIGCVKKTKKQEDCNILCWHNTTHIRLKRTYCHAIKIGRIANRNL